MDKKQKRLNITISFTNRNVTYKENERIYNYVKNKPNSSYYIRELVEMEMNSTQKEKKDISLSEKVDVSNFVSSIFEI